MILEGCQQDFLPDGTRDTKPCKRNLESEKGKENDLASSIAGTVNQEGTDHCF